MKKLFHIFLIVSSLMLSGQALSQATATLSADTILLGDQTVLTIRHALTFPSADALSSDGIVALRQEFTDDGKTQQTTLTSFEPGTHVIRLSPEDSLLLVVTDVVLDSADADIRDITPIQRIPFTFWEIARWVLLLLAVAALVAAVIILVRRHKKYGSIIVHKEVQDTRTPLQRALDSFEELRRKQLWQSGKQKEYQSELSDIVRRFIEEALSIRATDMTTDEILSSLLSSPWNESTAFRQAVVDRLRPLFSLADIVKFAKGEPLPNQHEHSLREAISVVEQIWNSLPSSQQPSDPKKESQQ